MKSIKIKFLVLIIIVLIFIPFLGFAKDSEKKVDLLLFYGQGCPHCSATKNFLDILGAQYPELNIIEYEIYFNAENRELFQKMAEFFGTEIQGVPTLFIDEKIVVGFSDALARVLEQEVQRCIIEGCDSPKNKLEKELEEFDKEESVEIIGESSPTESPEKIEITKKITISAVLAAAAVDAINPCAFAVLIILLTTILSSGSKKRALLAGLVFTTSIFISYFLMGLGLYSAIQVASLTHTFYFVIAILAVLIGLFNLKDYLWYGKWFKMEVPDSWRPALQKLIKGITSIPGAFLIGFVISLFLLPCTSGPYIIILGLLAKTTTRSGAIFLLLLYNFIFVLPMLLITGAVFFGFTTTEEAEEWRQKKLRILHLIAGCIILLLGIGILIAIKLGML
ncbi:MAG: glutaredoxin domain-containing protein [Patescibacteria group bacterium]|nr:glutaredoxin domain-containing protein [Patescibacteria group bacterium]